MLNQFKKPGRSLCSLGTGALLAGLVAGQAAGQYENYLLPDMMPWISGADRNGYGHGWYIFGDELRLSTAPLNAGVGHLEIWDDPSQEQDTDIDVYQRLYEVGGTYQDYIDVQVGNMINHPDHDHFHFEGYAVQRLRHVTEGNGVGEIAADGEKISFCMINIDRFSSDLFNNSTLDSDGDPIWYSGCTRGHTGISAGYADVYSSGLSGQFIDISGLEQQGGEFVGGLNGTGVYWLEVVIDPDNLMIESNNNNNTALLMIDLNNPGGEMDDHSNAKASATRLNLGDYRFGEVQWEGDVDQFSAEVVEGALYTITMDELQFHRGDMTVFDTTGTNQVFYEDLAADGQQSASYTFRANGTGDYYFEIGENVSSFGTRDGSYLLHWELLAIAGDVDQDGVVDITDLDLILASWGESVAAGTAGDFDADGTIGAGDLAILQANWGATLADYTAAVPEPGSLALLAMGGLALVRRRR